MIPRVRRLALGLGNPGPEYAGTRHNVGFDALDLVAARRGLLFRSPRHLEGWAGSRALRVALAPAVPDGTSAFALAKPETFMNLSGEAALPLVRWAGLGPEDLLVVVDDMDLELGALRLRPGGGHGGHNGLRSLVDVFGTNAFPRLRIGIGRATSTDAVRHVLGRFLPEEREVVDATLAQAGDALEAWLDGEALDPLMTRFHSRWTQAP